MVKKSSLITIILLVSLTFISKSVASVQLEQQLEKQLNPENQRGDSPQLVIINDTLIVAWEGDDGARITTSTDKGNNWSDVRRIRENVHMQKMTRYKNQIFITWVDLRRTHSYLIKSSDNGLTWTDEITLFEKNESKNNDFIRENEIIATSKGLYFFYLVILENYSQTLTYKYSSNDGNDWIDSERFLFYCSSDDWPGLIIDSFEDYIHIFLVQQYEASKELIYIRSEDSGVNWDQEIVLSYDPDRTPLYPDDGIDSMYPSGNLIENKIYCKWEDVGVGEFYRFSEDNGETWSDPQSFSIDAPGFFVKFKNEIYYFFDTAHLNQASWSINKGYDTHSSNLRDIESTTEYIHAVHDGGDHIRYRRYAEFHEQTPNHVDDDDSEVDDTGENGIDDDFLLILFIIILFLVLALISIFLVVRRRQKRH
jgi:hypothetical protein